MSKSENTMAEIFGILALQLVGMFYRGLALMVAWAWLIAERLSVRRMTYGEAVVAVILVSFAAERHNLKKDPDGPQSLAVSVGLNLLAPTLMIAVAYVAKAVL